MTTTLEPALSTGVAVRLDGVRKAFGPTGRAVVALDGMDLTVAPGEFVCLLGASGCGKSTLLNLVAGLLAPTSGSLSWWGEPTVPLPYVFATPCAATTGAARATGQGSTWTSRIRSSVYAGR